jgi:hypothetical protein
LEQEQIIVALSLNPLVASRRRRVEYAPSQEFFTPLAPNRSGKFFCFEKGAPKHGELLAQEQQSERGFS